MCGSLVWYFGSLYRFGYHFIISLVTGKNKYEINALMKKALTIIFEHKLQNNNNKMQFTLFFNIQLKLGRGRAFTCMTIGKYITLSTFQNRCPFLYNSSAFLLSFFALHSRIVWISFYLETSSLEPFSLFYDLIASYYTKGQ